MTELSADISSNGAVPPHAYASAHQTNKAFIQPLEATPEKSNPTILAGLILLGVVVFLFALSGVMVATQKSAIKTQETSITQSQAQINGPLRDANILATQFANGLNQYSQIKTKQRTFDPLWTDLSRRVVSGTRVSALSVDEQGVVQISGQATSFNAIALLIASLQRSESIEQVELVNSKSTDGAKEFSLSARFVASQVVK